MNVDLQKLIYIALKSLPELKDHQNKDWRVYDLHTNKLKPSILGQRITKTLKPVSTLRRFPDSWYQSLILEKDTDVNFIFVNKR